MTSIAARVLAVINVRYIAESGASYYDCQMMEVAYSKIVGRVTRMEL
jgi:hypothetical protein